MKFSEALARLYNAGITSGIEYRFENEYDSENRQLLKIQVDRIKIRRNDGVWDFYIYTEFPSFTEVIGVSKVNIRTRLPVILLRN